VNQDGGVGGGHLVQILEDFHERDAGADDIVKITQNPDLLFEVLCLDAQRVYFLLCGQPVIDVS
jgi:hypothetical protein